MSARPLPDLHLALGCAGSPCCSGCLPDTETSCETLARYIPSLDHPVLFYCNGVHCGRSLVAARIALDCGYARIYWFRGGFEEWKRKGLPYLGHTER